MLSADCDFSAVIICFLEHLTNVTIMTWGLLMMTAGVPAMTRGRVDWRLTTQEEDTGSPSFIQQCMTDGRAFLSSVHSPGQQFIPEKNYLFRQTGIYHIATVRCGQNMWLGLLYLVYPYVLLLFGISPYHYHSVPYLWHHRTNRDNLKEETLWVCFKLQYEAQFLVI